METISSNDHLNSHGCTVAIGHTPARIEQNLVNATVGKQNWAKTGKVNGPRGYDAENKLKQEAKGSAGHDEQCLCFPLQKKQRVKQKRITHFQPHIIYMQLAVSSSMYVVSMFTWSS